ncbi:MAG: hypothetical protein PHW74_06085 [Desulfobacca sp.]|nr:hypothetical protein [Desulfobacca sp.]
MNEVRKTNSVNEPTEPQKSASLVFAQIQDLFHRLGIFGQKLQLEFEGNKYLISCDARAFLVYRVNEQGAVPPGVPGWPVCLVTAETVVDECGPAPLKCEYFSTGLALPDWLEIIEQYYRPEPGDAAASG